MTALDQLPSSSFAVAPVALAQAESSTCASAPAGEFLEAVRRPERLSIRLIEHAEELPAIAADWNKLAGQNPFRRYEWLASWWRHYQTSRASLCVPCVVTETNKILGIAPWYIAASLGQGPVIRMLGSGEVCSEDLTILCQPENRAAVATAIANWLFSPSAPRWDLIELDHVPCDDVALTHLREQCASSGALVHDRPGMNLWGVELPDSWDRFVADLASSRRAKVRQSLRKFFASGKVRSYRLGDPSEFDRRFDLLVDLHQRRRRSLGQPGCFASASFAAFHREIARTFLEAGRLRLVWTELEGRPISVEYSLIGGDTIYYYQSGLEPEASNAGPGWLGMIGSLQLAVGEGYRRFEMLRGDEHYKLSWGASPRATLQTRIVAPRPIARMRHTLWASALSTRRWLKRQLRNHEKKNHENHESTTNESAKKAV